MMRARKRTVPVALPQSDEATGSWLRGIRFSGFTMLALGLLIVAIMVLAPGLRIFVEQRNELADLRAQVSQQQEQVTKMEAERARWDDPSYLRAQARNRLFFVMPGDVSYLVINDVVVEQDDTTRVSKSIQMTETDWVQSVFNSVMVAGLSSKPAEELQIVGGTDK